MFGVGLCLLAIVFSYQHVITALPTDGAEAGTSQISRDDGRLQTPDEFLKQYFPSKDINTIWQTINEDSGTNEHRLNERSGISSEEWKVADRLSDQARGLMCGTPGIFIRDSYKLLGIPKGFSTVVYPKCVRVNRCGKSGCCADGFTCKKTQNVFETKQFLLYDKSTDKMQLKSFDVINHADCFCGPKPGFQFPNSEPEPSREPSSGDTTILSSSDSVTSSPSEDSSEG